MKENNSPGPFGNVADRPGQIPQEHIALTMNSLLCEKLYGFQRVLGDDGRFSWKAKKDDGTEVDALFDFVDDPGTALRLIDRVCDHQKWGWSLNKEPENPMVNVALYLMATDGPALIAQVSGKPIGLAISLCIAGALKLDPPSQHRILYPGHYMSLS